MNKWRLSCIVWQNVSTAIAYGYRTIGTKLVNPLTFEDLLPEESHDINTRAGMLLGFSHWPPTPGVRTDADYTDWQDSFIRSVLQTDPFLGLDVNDPGRVELRAALLLILRACSIRISNDVATAAQVFEDILRPSMVKYAAIHVVPADRLNDNIPKFWLEDTVIPFSWRGLLLAASILDIT